MSAKAAPWRGAFVVLAAALIWVAYFDRWSPSTWGLPTDYVGDAHETLARLKAASEGDMIPLGSQVITRLGAPFGAHWNSYPSPDKPLMLALGAAVNVFGLYGAANLGFLLAQISGALAFYVTARWLRCRWEWAAAGALLFAYTYHTFHRGLAHFSLVYVWTVPLGLMAVWLVSRSQRLTWGRPGAAICLVAGVALGFSNPYNLFFWLQLMGWAVLLQFLGARRIPNLQIGLCTIGVALVACVLTHLEMWLHVSDTRALPLLARNYAGTERYALKIVEMFIPPPYHSWDWLAFFGGRYMRWSEWRGETFLPYLGLAGIAGAIWLGVVTLRTIVARRPLPGQTLAIGWIIAYCTLGGLTNLVALFAGIQLFRATNRAAIFISAIVLFFLVVRLSRLTSTWPGWVRAAAALLVAGIGVMDQLPRTDSNSDLNEIARAVAEDKAFGLAMEESLPRGSMVFQLPVLGFPEVLSPHQLTDYAHFRPYLATEHLRFSYGAPKFRARGRWQQEVANLPIKAAVQKLESHGFAALYVDRRGFHDRGEKILGELIQLGYDRRITSASGDRVVIPLRPMESPEPPFARALTLGRGWHVRPDDGIRWAFQDAALSFFNPYPDPTTVDLKLTLTAISPRYVSLRHEGEPLQGTMIGSAPVTLHLPAIQLVPGVNRFTLDSASPPIRADSGSNRSLRSFGIKNSVVSRPTSVPPRPRRSGQ